MRRRSFLITLLPLLAGCVNNGTQTPVSSPTSTDGNGATSTAAGSVTKEPLPNIPKPTDDCTVADRPTGDYPGVPGSLTESNAASFALDYETVYAQGVLHADPSTESSMVAQEEASVVETTKTGALVRVTLTIDVTRESGATTIDGSENAYGWYYVTESFAVRAPGDGTESRPTEGWEPVACA